MSFKQWMNKWNICIMEFYSVFKNKKVLMLYTHFSTFTLGERRWKGSDHINYDTSNIKVQKNYLQTQKLDYWETKVRQMRNEGMNSHDLHS